MFGPGVSTAPNATSEIPSTAGAETTSRPPQLADIIATLPRARRDYQGHYPDILGGHAHPDAFDTAARCRKIARTRLSLTSLDIVEERDLRVSDGERQHIAELLQRAFCEGYLTLTEFEQRTDAVFASTTRGELNAVVADIPAIRQAQQQDPAPVPQRPFAQAGDQLRSLGTSLNRRGSWEVPAALRLYSRFSSAVLDFTEAVIRSAVVYVEIDDIATAVPRDTAT